MQGRKFEGLHTLKGCVLLFNGIDLPLEALTVALQSLEPLFIVLCMGQKFHVLSASLLQCVAHVIHLFTALLVLLSESDLKLLVFLLNG